LKTLTIIRDALRLIKQNHGIEIDIDTIPLDDEKTLAMYQRGETNGTFQFESVGMQKHLRDLKPDKFEDLIAMNALFRPGPIAYIPKFINRKHGREAVTYDLDASKEFLEETYGITVYQEQVMLLSQKLANFTKGEADTLRKAMGKKQKDVLDKMKSKFIDGCVANGHDKKVSEKVWSDWEAFASYAFNKSHSTCYAFVAFQTGYLKANYPAEYMSAVMTHNLSNIDKITFFMEECRRMNIPVLGPDVNESFFDFSVNKSGQIRFGLGAVKGVGESAVESIINDRNENGFYTSIFDLTRRVAGKAINKRCLESLAQAGALDCFEGIHRAQYFYADAKDGITGIEKAVRFGNNVANNFQMQQHSLFGDALVEDYTIPVLPVCDKWNQLEELRREKEVIGFYISGHPLDNFKFEIRNFCNISLDKLGDITEFKGRDLSFAGIITDVGERITKSGKPFGTFVLEDFTGNHSISLFGKEYGAMKHYLHLESQVFVRAKVQNRNFTGEPDKDFWELKPYSIDFLQDAVDKLVKEVTINIRLSSVREGMVVKLVDSITRHKGSTSVKINVVDVDKNWNVPFVSKLYKVKITSEWLDEIKSITNGEVSLA
jgi:DNA polymerase-3 subunit alpha